VITVPATLPLLETQTSSQGVTIVPQQIVDMPINGRNYLDLLQLVPGVALNRQADQGSDNAVPVLGERGNNLNFWRWLYRDELTGRATHSGHRGIAHVFRARQELERRCHCPDPLRLSATPGTSCKRSR